jgi:hypothetical protein
MSATRQTELDVVGDALKELAKQFLEAWPDHTGKYYFLLGAGLDIAKAAQSAEPVQGEADAYIPVDRETGEHWHPVKRKGSGHICDYIPLYTSPAKPDDELLELLQSMPTWIGGDWADKLRAKLAEMEK